MCSLDEYESSSIVINIKRFSTIILVEISRGTNTETGDCNLRLVHHHHQFDSLQRILDANSNFFEFPLPKILFHHHIIISGPTLASPLKPPSHLHFGLPTFPLNSVHRKENLSPSTFISTKCQINSVWR
jgi:hypothetical protein